LFFVFAAMAHKVTNNWKDHEWWIMAEDAEMPMLRGQLLESNAREEMGTQSSQVIAQTP
jgi:hypothetical protein